jgi:hypothetical protein
MELSTTSDLLLGALPGAFRSARQKNHQRFQGSSMMRSDGLIGKLCESLNNCFRPFQRNWEVQFTRASP